MDKFDRIQQLHRILRSHRRPVPLGVIADRLACSERNARRIIETMQNMLDAPIDYNRELNGWQYVESPHDQFELPGLWLTGEELQSLTLLLHVLQNLGNGLFSRELTAIERQIHELMEARGISVSAFTDHIRILPIGNRQLPSKVFHAVTEAVLNGTQVKIRYKSFDRRDTERTISPQNLVFYRENWYLDAFCQLRNELRTFAVARISAITKLKTKAISIPESERLPLFSRSYGIFAGEPQHVALLRFGREVAHEVACQNWHPRQKGQWRSEEYLLAIPYGDHRELVQDILRYVPYVDVESPMALRQEVVGRLRAGLELLSEG